MMPSSSTFREQKCARKIFSYHTLQYIYGTLQFIFLTLSNLNKTSNRAVTQTYKMCDNRCVLLKSICTCDQCDSPFCALQLTALIKPNWCVLLYCCACWYHSLMVMQPSWTTVPCPTTKISSLISKSFVGIKQSVISVTLKTPLKTRLGICIYKTLLPHRPDDFIGFTSSCSPHILQQNCAHD